MQITAWTNFFLKIPYCESNKTDIYIYDVYQVKRNDHIFQDLESRLVCCCLLLLWLLFTTLGWQLLPLWLIHKPLKGRDFNYAMYSINGYWLITNNL